MEKFIDGTCQSLMVHDKEKCEGEYCCIHNPSNHHMVDWPLYWRFDRRFFERIDPEGVGHPDPDEIEYHKKHGNDISIHGCNGLCHSANYKKYCQEKEKSMENVKTEIDWVEDFEEFLKQENVWNYFRKHTEETWNKNVKKVLKEDVYIEDRFLYDAFEWELTENEEVWKKLDDKWNDYLVYWKSEM